MIWAKAHHTRLLWDSHGSSLPLEKSAVVIFQATDVAHSFTPHLLHHHQRQLRLGILHWENKNHESFYTEQKRANTVM